MSANERAVISQRVRFMPRTKGRAMQWQGNLAGRANAPQRRHFRVTHNPFHTDALEP